MSPDPVDHHTIETPEQIQLAFPLAGIGSRFLAVAIDTLIQGAIGVAFFVVGTIVGISLPSKDYLLWVIGAGFFALFLIMFGYFALFEILWNGQTPGKRVIGIRVVKDSGRPLSPVESIGRNLMRILDQLPAFYAIGMISALANSRNKRLGDLVAGSIVVRESSLSEFRPIWETGQHVVRADVNASALSVEDLALIDAFLARRRDLAPDVRTRIAGEILSRITPKMSMVPPGDSAESILESLAYLRRSTGA